MGEIFGSLTLTALLRAISEKLIPGIPEEARISILQQTNDSSGSDGSDAKANRRTVLEEVIERATAKDELEQEIQSEFWKTLNKATKKKNTTARC